MILINKDFAARLLDWYPLNKRDLPWRNTNQPYIIWLSEVILQQTRVPQGLPYFEKFLLKYPTLRDLANAPSDEVMRLWQGLGYYSRARNLHQCAKDVVEKYDGQFPENYKDLLKLKGVGRYTAAAIASFAFGESVAVVDGNVFRILSRYFGIASDIGSPSGKNEFEALANALIPKTQAGEFNQAIMEFGSLQCKPKNPDCEICVLKNGCFAFKKGVIDQLPFKGGKIKIRERYFTYAHIQCGKEVVVHQRVSGDIWQGLYDFPLIEYQKVIIQDPKDLIYYSELESFKPIIYYNAEKTFKHILTHQRIFANFVSFVIEEEYREALDRWSKKNGFSLVTGKKLETLGKPRLLLRFLEDEK